MVVKDAISALESKNCRQEDKEAAYATIFKTMKSDAASLYEEELKAHGLGLMKSLHHDILHSDEKVSLCALQVLHSCLEDANLGSMGKAESLKMLQALLQCGHRSPSVEVMKQVISCLASQQFQADVIKSKMSAIVDLIEEMNVKVKSKSASALEEIVNLFTRLDEQIDKDLKPYIPQLGRLIFPGLACASETVRDKSLVLLEKYINDLSGAPDLSKHVVKAISAGLAQSLKCLVTKNDIYVLRAWAVVIQVVGKELHKGSSINAMLEVIELGFKSSPQVRRQAFVSWRSLIDNFALDKNVISDAKRIKLIMMVLKIDNAKTETVALEKLKTWWHFVTSMGPKLSVNIEQVVYPLLQFCVGNGKLHSVTSLLGQSPRLALKTPAANSPSSLMSSGKGTIQQLPVFPAIQKLGCEVIAQLLSPGKVHWDLAPLSSEVFTSSTTFVKHAPIILMTTQELFKSMGKQIDEKLVLCIWKSLVNNLKVALESPVKSECRDIFSSFLSLLQCLVQGQVFDSQALMSMIQLSSDFPQKVLASTAYTISGLTLRVSHLISPKKACPALLLCELLLNSSVMEPGNTNDSYLKLFSSLVSAGASNVQGALLFLQSVTEMLESQAFCLDSHELLCKMWSTLAVTLQDTVNTTNEVNQGDALEYNFGCMYAVLLLPVSYQLPSKLAQLMCKIMVKTWRDLYHSFARLSALVATAEANTCLEEMSAKILQKWQPEFKDPVNMEFVTVLCQKMIDCADFSSLTAGQATGGLTLSPSKWTRRRQKPLGNLHSFVHLLGKLQTELNSLLCEKEKDGLSKKNSTIGSIPTVAHTLVEVYTKMFTHITTTGIISSCLRCLAEPMAKFYQGNTKSGSVNLYVPSFISKLEKLLQEISNCITGRYSGQYDTEFLEVMSPLFEATFMHSRRAIKNQTLILWNTTFSRSTSLEYPDSLKPILCKVKEKSSIALPGWMTSDEAAVIAETPFSEMSMGDSQAPAPLLPGMPSPKRQKGSMLNKHVSPVRKTSPGPKVSPVKVVDPKEARNLFSSARKQIAVDFLPEEEFVVINSSSTKKKRVLTDHQREVLKEKSVLPAMYNNLDASQDISLMSHFGTDSQHGSASSSADVITINSSESQESSDHSKARKESSVKDSSNIDSFATPQPVTSAPRRRSVRIKDMKTADDAEDTDKIDTQSRDSNSSSRDSKESKTLDSKSCEIQHKGKENGSNGTENTNKDSTISPNSSPEEIVEKTPPQNNSAETDSPFGMFRRKSQPLVADDQSTSPVSLSQDSGIAKSNSHKVRISLRKIHSQDDIPPLAKTDCITSKEKRKERSPEKGKSPRRVPLKKIDEHENELKEKQSASRPTRSRHLSAPSSNLDKWIEKSDNLCKQSISPTKEIQDEASVTASHTLVEDTQSPFKMSKQTVKQSDSSIAETPTKGEDSHSPINRASSARKLFVDGAAKYMEAVSEEIDASDKDAIVVSHATKSGKPEDCEIPSSQGFETKTKESEKEKDHHTMFGFSQLDSQKESTDNAAESQKIMPESQNLFANSLESKFSLDIMPTMASPSKELQKFSVADDSKSTSSDSAKTTSGSSDLSNKPTSSSESDFNPSQPTLRDNSSQDKRRNRKKAVPKKYSPVKRQRRPIRSKALKKKYPCCRIPNLCDHKSELEVNNKDSEIKDSNQLDSDLPAHSKSDNEEVKKSPQKSKSDNSNTAIENNAKDSEKGEGDDKLTKIKELETVSPEIGEVTPDMKSPSTDTPQRRHSTTKRRGPWIKRLSDKVMAKKSLNSKVSQNNETSDSDDSAPIRLRKRKQESQSDKLEKQKESPAKKRKKSFHRMSGTPPKSKHLLRARNKGLKRLSHSDPSPPRKVRKLIQKRLRHSTDEDNEPLSAIQKRQSEKKEKLINEASDPVMKKETHDVNAQEEEEDKDLTQLKNIATVKGCQRNKIIDLTEEDGNELLASCVDDALNTALSQISASVQSQNKNDGHINASSSVDLNPESEDVMDFSEDYVAPPQSFVVDDSQDHLQAAQKVVSVKEGTVHNENNKGDGVVITPSDASKESVSASSKFVEVWDHVGQLVDRSQESMFTEEDIMDRNTEIMEPSSVNAVIVEPNNQTENKVTEKENKSPEDKQCLDTIDSDMTDEANQPIEKDPMEIGSVEVGCVESQQAQNSGTENGHPEAGSENLVAEVNCSKNQITVSAVDNSAMEEPSQMLNEENQDLKPSEEGNMDKQETNDDQTVDDKDGDDAAQQEEQEEHVLYDWSPTKSPSCSILKTSTGPPKTSAEPCNSGQSRRVSFAEPVVSGESPVREKYHSESLPTSPLIISRSGEGKTSLFIRSLGRASGYRKRLHSSSPRKEPSWSRLTAKHSMNSPTFTQQSQTVHKPTPESQLDSTGPIFPDLVDCSKPLDKILPQLTSSLWYRGLCQLMKGRNLNTIGDLSSLTEVQINQLPIRNPKIETVKATLKAYMNQHGLTKVSKVMEEKDVTESLRSKGATFGQEVTPSSIADDGIKVHPSAEQELEQWSPIKDPDSAKGNQEQTLMEASSSDLNEDCDGKNKQSMSDDNKGQPTILSSLEELVKHSQSAGLKNVSTAELFDIHQKLNSLFGSVVEEMKMRKPNT